jgi:CheY-like chemotaxis protein
MASAESSNTGMARTGAGAGDSSTALSAGGAVLYFDPNPTAAKLATAGLRLAGYAVLHAASLDQAVELCRTHGPAGDQSIAALLLDTATAPAVSAAVLRALLEVPGAASLPGMLLVSRANPVPFPGAESLPSLKRPFTTPALLKFLRDAVDVVPTVKPQRTRATPDDAVLRLEIALQQFFPELEPDTETLRRFAATLNTMAELPTLASNVTFQATLGSNRLESVLEMLDADGTRGVLTIENAQPGMRAVARLHIDRGRVRMAEATIDGEDLRLERFLLELEAITPAQLEAHAAADDPQQQGLALRLLEGGHARVEDIATAIANQAREIACQALLWTTGRITFAPSEQLHPIVVQLGRGQPELRIAEVVMVGLRRNEERAEMGPHMAGLEEVFVRVDDEVARLGRHAFARDELGVLELLNGRNSIKDVARKTKTGTFAVTKVLYRLSRSGLARRAAPPVRT